MADETSKVTVEILADTSGFKKEMKSVAKATTDLGKLTAKFRKSGLGTATKASKSTGKSNKAQIKANKEINNSIKTTLGLMKKQQKATDSLNKSLEKQLSLMKKIHGTGGGGGGGGRGGGRDEGMGGRRSGGRGKGLMSGRGPAGINILKGLPGMITGAIVGAVGSLVGLVGHQIKKGYTSYVGFGRARAGLSGMGKLRGGTNETTGGTGVFAESQRLGFSATETVQQMRGIGKQTGNINAVGRAQRVARSFGGSVSEVGQFMGTMTRSGQGFGGKMGRGGEKALTRIMQHAFTGGLDRSRAGEHLTAVAQAVQSAQSVTGGKVDATSISGLLTMFSRGGAPGLQGAAGMAQLSKFDQGMKAVGSGGGGGAAGALMMQAMGFGTPGGTTSAYEAERGLQRGVFGEGGAANLMKVITRFDQAGGGAGSEQSNKMLNRTFGLSYDVLDEIREVIADSGGDTTSVLEEIEKITSQQLPTEDQILKVDQEHLTVAERSAHLSNRLVSIGEQNAVAIEQIEDTLNEIVNKFMPLAVDILQIIADFLKFIWEGIRGFFNKWNSQNQANETVRKASSGRADILKRLQLGPDRGGITKEQAYEELTELLQGQSQALKDIENPGALTDLYERVGHAATAVGRLGLHAAGISTTPSAHTQRRTRRMAGRRAVSETQELRLAVQGGNQDVIESAGSRDSRRGTRAARLSVPEEAMSPSPPPEVFDLSPNPVGHNTVLLMPPVNPNTARATGSQVHAETARPPTGTR